MLVEFFLHTLVWLNLLLYKYNCIFVCFVVVVHESSIDSLMTGTIELKEGNRKNDIYCFASPFCLEF